MAEHAHTTLTPVARRRAARPAGGVLDTRDPPAAPTRGPIIRIRLPGTLDGPFGRIARVQLEHHVARILAILDAWDGDVEGKCDAEDSVLDGTGQWDDGGSRIGSEEDAEYTGDDEPHLGWNLDGTLVCNTADDDQEHDTADAEPGEANDAFADRLTCVMGGVPA